MAPERPHGYAEIVKFFGDPRVITIGGKVHVDAAWEDRSMVLVRDLPGITRLYVHRLIVEPLRAALKKSAEQYGWKPKTIGCFAPRAKRGVAELSVHTFGAAVDVDASDNRLIVDCRLDDPRRSLYTIPSGVVAIWEAEGFFWGGRFKNRFDPMHFQLCDGY